MSSHFSFSTLTHPSTVRLSLIVSSLLYGFGCVRGYWILCIPYPLIGFYFLRLKIRRSFWWFWLSGLTTMLICVQWVMEINTTSWGLTINAEVMGFMLLFWVLCALVFSFGWLFIIAIWKLKPFYSKEPIKLAIWYAGAFAVSEWVRSLFFSLVVYGKESTIGTHWSFGSLGLMMAGSPLAGLTRLFGMYGTTFIIIVFCLLCMGYIKLQNWKKLGILVFTFVCFLGICSLFTIKPRSLQSMVTIVNIPFQRVQEKTLDKRLPANYQPPDTQNHIIFLPEYSGISDAGVNSSEKIFLDRLSDAPNTAYVDAYKLHGQKGTYNELSLFRKDIKEQSSKKRFLIPFGEYSPYLTEEIFKRTGNSKILSTIKKDNIQSSPRSIDPLSFNGDLFGTLACSGAIAPELYRDLVNKNADVLVSIADLGFFYQSQSYYAQQRIFARFQAVSQARPFIQSTRQGPSIATDANGRILSYMSGPSDIRVSNLELKTFRTKTIYTLLGEWVIYVLLITGTASIIRRFLKN